MFSEDSTFRKGPGGLLFAQIENDLAKATVCLQGAQLTHWQPRSSVIDATAAEWSCWSRNGGEGRAWEKWRMTYLL